MKKRLITSELGSMMIEALAMLALIAAITPILYRKTAERTTELQDINSAGEIRSIIKAVDDYVSANFDAISQGESVTTTCGENSSFNYEDFKDGTNAHVTVPLGHFCEFLPYGVLDSSGNAKASRLFSSNYQVVLKLKGGGEENDNRVITSFVVTDPNIEMKEMRSSSIASMIGGNGGYVTEGSTGSGEDVSGGKIAGNLGIWGIENAKEELGVTVKKGAIVAASIQGISSQNAKIDVEGVLYRKVKSDPELNTMSTTLYMGATGSAERNSIVNIRDLIVGGEAQGANTLYINQGAVSMGESGTESFANFSSAGVTWKYGTLYPDGNGLNMRSTAGKTNIIGTLTTTVDADIGGNLNVVGSADIGNTLDVSDILHVGDDTADAGFIIGPAQTTVKMPINVTATNSCTSADWTQCALNVAGDVHVGGDLTVDNSFSAKNLHAQEKLTVGTDNKTLNITYTTGSEASTLNFGDGFITAEKTPSKQIFRIGPDTDNFFVADKKTNAIYANAEQVYLHSTTASGYTGFGSVGVSAGIYTGPTAANLSAYFEIQPGGTVDTVANTSYTMTSPIIQANTTEHLINLNYDATSSNGIFKVTPNGGADNYYFSIENTAADTGSLGKVNVKGMPTYMSGNKANLTMTGGADIIVQNTAETPKNIVRIGDNADPDSGQIDISSDGIFAKDSGTGSTGTDDTSGNNVLKIDLTANSKSNEKYPVYIRKGAIELTDGLTADESGNITATNGMNYVKADRFVANLPLESTALVDHGGTAIGGMSRYEVNPAYTSVMHDIKLTSRGGARLSDILPDFINKGIYLVDNTYPALGYKCDGYTGISVNEYRDLTRANKQGVGTCSFTNDKVSSWLGFVPTPTCPPGYSKVITVTPVGFNIAQAGILYAGNNAEGDPIDDISIMSYSKPVSTATGATDMPLYHQKNTWLKSFAEAYEPTDGVFEGWDVGIGYMYPEYAFGGIDELLASTPGLLEPDKTTSEDGSIEVIWNLFPVYAGTLEGYATVYCYFNRANGMWNPYIVDTQYDQLGNFRAVDSKSGGSKDTFGAYLDRLIEGGNSNLTEW